MFDNLWVRLRVWQLPGMAPGSTEKGNIMKDITVVVVEPEGDVYEANTQSRLEVFQGLVGGSIEGVFGDGYTMYVHGEGFIIGLPFNRKATEFVNRGTNADVVLYGTVVILGPGDEAGNDTSVREHVINHFTKEN